MKNIYKILTLSLVAIIATSCDRDTGDYPYLDRDIIVGFSGASGSLLVETGLATSYPRQLVRVL